MPAKESAFAALTNQRSGLGRATQNDPGAAIGCQGHDIVRRSLAKRAVKTIRVAHFAAKCQVDETSAENSGSIRKALQTSGTGYFAT